LRIANGKPDCLGIANDRIANGQPNCLGIANDRIANGKPDCLGIANDRIANGQPNCLLIANEKLECLSNVKSKSSSDNYFEKSGELNASASITWIK
jgi:hypothetical protein